MDHTNTILFLFFTGVFDILFTTITVLKKYGFEINPIWNWIQPTWLMCSSMILLNLVFCIILIPLLTKYDKKYPLKTAIYSWIGIHIAGTITGISAIMQNYIS